MGAGCIVLVVMFLLAPLFSRGPHIMGSIIMVLWFLLPFGVLGWIRRNPLDDEARKFFYPAIWVYVAITVTFALWVTV